MPAAATKANSHGQIPRPSVAAGTSESADSTGAWDGAAAVTGKSGEPSEGGADGVLATVASLLVGRAIDGAGLAAPRAGARVAVSGPIRVENTERGAVEPISPSEGLGADEAGGGVEGGGGVTVSPLPDDPLPKLKFLSSAGPTVP